MHEHSKLIWFLGGGVFFILAVAHVWYHSKSHQDK